MELEDATEITADDRLKAASSANSVLQIVKHNKNGLIFENKNGAIWVSVVSIMQSLGAASCDSEEAINDACRNFGDAEGELRSHEDNTGHYWLHYDWHTKTQKQGRSFFQREHELH